MIYALTSIVVASMGQTILKGALNSMKLSPSGFNLDFALKVAGNGGILLGLGFYGFSALLWLYALSENSLTRIYPLTGLSFVLVVLLARFVLGESPSVSQALGIILIVLGMGLVSL